MEVIIAYIRWKQELIGGGEDASPIKLVEPLCPWIIAASLLIFSGFSLLSIRRNYARLANHMFFVYLVHVGVWDVLYRVVKKLFGIAGDSRILIPILVLIVFGVSLLLSVIWNRIYHNVYQRNGVI